MMDENEEDERSFDFTIPSAGKFQFADVISNDEETFDVHVIGDAIQVVYRTDIQVDLSWAGEFLSRHGYEYTETQNTNTNLAKDIFVPSENNQAENDEKSGLPAVPAQVQ